MDLTFPFIFSISKRLIFVILRLSHYSKASISLLCMITLTLKAFEIITFRDMNSGTLKMKIDQTDGKDGGPVEESDGFVISDRNELMKKLLKKD